MLDRFQLAGVIASWWGSVQYDIKTLAFHGFNGVIQGWLTTIEAAFVDDEDEDTRDKQRRAAEKRKAREHRIVPVLIRDYLTALEETETRRAELDARVKAAMAAPDEDDDSAETFSPQELRKLKEDLADTRSEARHIEAQFLDRLRLAVLKLDAKSREDLVRHILKADLQDRLDAEVAVGCRILVNRYHTWVDKYAITLHDLEARRDKTAARLNAYLKDLGYD